MSIAVLSEIYRSIANDDEATFRELLPFVPPSAEGNRLFLAAAAHRRAGMLAALTEDERFDPSIESLTMLKRTARNGLADAFRWLLAHPAVEFPHRGVRGILVDVACSKDLGTLRIILDDARFDVFSGRFNILAIVARHGSEETTAALLADPRAHYLVASSYTLSLIVSAGNHKTLALVVAHEKFRTNRQLSREIFTRNFMGPGSVTARLDGKRVEWNQVRKCVEVLYRSGAVAFDLFDLIGLVDSGQDAFLAMALKLASRDGAVDVAILEPAGRLAEKKRNWTLGKVLALLFPGPRATAMAHVLPLWQDQAAALFEHQADLTQGMSRQPWPLDMSRPHPIHELIFELGNPKNIARLAALMVPERKDCALTRFIGTDKHDLPQRFISAVLRRIHLLRIYCGLLKRHLKNGWETLPFELWLHVTSFCY